MCGIALLIYRDATISSVARASEESDSRDISHDSDRASCASLPASHWSSIIANASEKLSHRGPDSLNVVERHGVTLISSVLGLRGELTPQPLISPSGDILCFNGEIFGGLQVNEGENDTRRLLAAIEEHGLQTTVLRVQGPFALVYYEAASNTLYYGRDVLGRRSLLTQESNGILNISSVVLGNVGPACEVEPGHVCVIDLSLPAGEPRLAFDVPTLPRMSIPLHPPSDPTMDEVADILRAFRETLTEALRIRLVTLPMPPTPSAARIAILFSGGLDSAVLACLTGLLSPPEEPIDLLNVAFESPRALKALTDGAGKYDVPDRLTAKRTLQELRTIQPSREWRLIEVDVPFDVAEAAKPTVLDLLQPQTSEMDLSIGLALHFAASGPTSARALISGLGADETMGGYLRHRRAYERTGWKGMAEEMQMDLDRIGTRNCGRDDRVISVHGKEVRYPFLDENVLSFLASTPLPIRCDPPLGESQGDKRLLRRLAAQLGLTEASALPKRAMQFGSRSAKREITSGRSKGTDAIA